MRIVFVLLLAMLAGCSKLTLVNYDRLQVGMSYAEVTDILGKPEQCSDALLVRSCRWGQGTEQATVNFVAGKAVLFSAEGLS